MGVELRPLGVKCNIQCQYCYQNPQRDAGNVLREYDMELMKKRVAEEGGGFTLFGGEPLLIPIKDLEELWSWGLDRYGRNAIQTNGTLINDDHLRLFKKYKVQVGISVDGPLDLNDVRWTGSLAGTRAATQKTHTAIKRLCSEGIAPSLIVTLHRGNATRDKIPLMHEWFRELDKIGVAAARLHVLEIDHAEVRQKYELTAEENVEALVSFARLEKSLPRLKFDVFRDMRNMLQGKDNRVTCVWSACDPYTTRAVRGVEGNGQSSNCGRTNKDGVDYTKASHETYERYIALYSTPQEFGGCKDCRFFLMCKGQCPGTAIEGDWRNRTEHCEIWMKLYELLEEECLDAGIVPLSMMPKRTNIEKQVLEGWSRGRMMYLHEALQKLSSSKQQSSEEMMAMHGRSYRSDGHGDRHGDHSDYGPRATRP